MAVGSTVGSHSDLPKLLQYILKHRKHYSCMSPNKTLTAYFSK